MNDQKLNIIVMRAGFTDADMYKEVLKQFPVGFCIAVNNENPHLLEGSNYLWINSSNAKWGKYGVCRDDLIPLDEELIEKMAWCETYALDMMTRFEDRRVITYDQRRRLYLRHLRYWNDMIVKKEINLYITGGVPHELPEWIIFSLCRHYGIPTILFQTGPVVHTTFLMHDWEETVIQLKGEYAKLSYQYRNAEEAEIPLSPDYGQYFEEQIRKGDAKPWDDNVKKKSFLEQLRNIASGTPSSLWHIASLLIKPSLWLKKMQTWAWLRRAKHIYRFYDRNVKEPDFNRRFIYIPLQLQPECSTCPQAGAYRDQLLIVQMLSKLLPDDIFLYVKEHPSQEKLYGDGRGRTLSFYEDLLKVSRVQFVPKNTSSDALTRHSIAIATPTGTAGFEALFRGKPALLFGHRFFQYAPGIFPIRTAEDCNKALDEIINKDVKPTTKEMRIFLKAVENIAIHAAFWRDFKETEGFTREENNQNLATAIVNDIKSIMK